MAQLSIGEVARRASVRTSAIRYYEDAGLLPSPRRVSGRRVYDDEIFTRLTLIDMAQEAGFTVAEIRVLMEGFTAETPASERWHALATAKLIEVDAMIARAERMRALLEQALRCGCLRLEDCAALGWREPPDRVARRSRDERGGTAARLKGAS
jgi:MerR family redox-sensitive transcriptional activator SoxR